MEHLGFVYLLLFTVFFLPLFFGKFGQVLGLVGRRQHRPADLNRWFYVLSDLQLVERGASAEVW